MNLWLRTLKTELIIEFSLRISASFPPLHFEKFCPKMAEKNMTGSLIRLNQMIFRTQPKNQFTVHCSQFTRISVIAALLLAVAIPTQAQKPYRTGTTTANFLEIGYGAAGNAMGDAFVSLASDPSAIYWNPAGLGYLENTQLLAMSQPWIAGISTNFVGFSMHRENFGTFGLGFISASYGAEDVTTVFFPEGTGESFDGQDVAVSLSYSRRLVDWFSFGVSGKFISSRIWHESGSAAAIDLGAIVNTNFLSRTGRPGDGLNIGMSISNYGTRMSFSGIDLKRPIDIQPDEDGNFATTPALYELEGWELPLIFRLGTSFHVISSRTQRLTVAVDALHPNNNSESLNLGAQYTFELPSFGQLQLRGGYKGVYLVDSEYGASFGFGLKIYYFNNKSLNIDYSYREVGLLGKMQAYSLSFVF